YNFTPILEKPPRRGYRRCERHSRHSVGHPRPGADSTKPNSLLDVLPVRGVESPCYDQEQAKEQQHPYAQPLAEELVGFGHPAQEVRQVGNVIVERSLVRGVERVLGGFTATVVLQHLRAGFSV